MSEHLKRAHAKLMSARESLALAHHEGYAANNGSEFGQITVLLETLDKVWLPRLGEIARRFPSDLQGVLPQAEAAIRKLKENNSFTIELPADEDGVLACPPLGRKFIEGHLLGVLGYRVTGVRNIENQGSFRTIAEVGLYSFEVEINHGWYEVKLWVVVKPND